MTQPLNNGNSNHSITSVMTKLNGLKKGLSFAFGLALALMLQVTFFSSGAIASPLANIFGDQVDKVTQGVKTDMEIDKAAGITKDLIKNAKGKIDEGVEKTKKMAGDRANEVKENTKNLPDQAGNKVEEAIDSVKNFLGQ
jgi:hypothetical protein